MVPLMAVLMLLAGCASSLPPKQTLTRPPAQNNLSAAAGWWHARFKISWPPNTDPRWPVDLLLAQRVIAPVLDRFGGQIRLWRFHRRAARDAAGHQFSFIFYSSAATARQVYQAIGAQKMLADLNREKILERVIFDTPGKPAQPGIGDTSDKHWSRAVQDTWPYYIMGVSRMWLGLIDSYVRHQEKQPRPASLSETLALYSRANDAITHIWQEEGRHAFLHHLNAIFGYKSLAIYEKRWVTF